MKQNLWKTFVFVISGLMLAGMLIACTAPPGDMQTPPDAPTAQEPTPVRNATIPPPDTVVEQPQPPVVTPPVVEETPVEVNMTDVNLTPSNGTPTKSNVSSTWVKKPAPAGKTGYVWYPNTGTNKTNTTNSSA